MKMDQQQIFFLNLSNGHSCAIHQTHLLLARIRPLANVSKFAEYHEGQIFWQILVWQV
jgi:hypothetical protein